MLVRRRGSRLTDTILAIDEPEVFKNAPVCLQLVSKRHADEVVMQAMKSIEKVLPLRN